MGRIHTVGPNKAIIVTKKNKTKIISGGWAYALPAMHHVQYLSLGLMTLRPECYDVRTVEGVPISASGVAQCKIMSSPEFIRIAAEQFLGKRMQQIGYAIQQTLEGHLRAILGTLTVEELIRDRLKFAGLVREVAMVDVAKMGIQIVSFVIKDIDDGVGYLSSLGKTKTAAVKRDARIGVANANRDAGIREAECEREANAVKCQVDINIENYSRIHFVQRAQFDAEVNAAKAEAQLAYPLKVSQIQQQLRHEELAIDIIERKKLTEIENIEIERKEKELESAIKLPSEAESYRIETIAKGMKTMVIEEAAGEGEKIKKIGAAEGFRIQVVGLKEAERMALRANALKGFGDAAIKHLVIDSLPTIASHISAPLSKIDEIVILGGSNNNLASNLAAIVAQIPPTLEALNIPNIKKAINKKLSQPTI